MRNGIKSGYSIAKIQREIHVHRRLYTRRLWIVMSNAFSTQIAVHINTTVRIKNSFNLIVRLLDNKLYYVSMQVSNKIRDCATKGTQFKYTSKSYIM